MNVNKFKDLMRDVKSFFSQMSEITWSEFSVVNKVRLYNKSNDKEVDDFSELIEMANSEEDKVRGFDKSLDLKIDLTMFDRMSIDNTIKFQKPALVHTIEILSTE
jgi:hypothetical protein